MNPSRGAAAAPVRRYALAVAYTAAAVLLRLLLDVPLGQSAPFLFPGLAVLASALLEGLAPAFTSLFLGALAEWYLFAGPPQAAAHPKDSANFPAFVLCGALAALVCGLLRRALIANRERESRLLGIFKLLPQLVWIADKSGECQSVNDRWVEYFGVSALDGLGHGSGNSRGCGWLQHVHPEDRARVSEKWNHALAAGAEFQLEFRLRSRSGAYRWFSSRAIPFRDREGRPTEWVGSHTDIHELREMRRTLQDEEERLKLVAATVPGVIFTFRLGPDGAYSLPYSSPSVTVLCGLTPEELARDFSPLALMMHPDDIPYFREAIAESARDLSPVRAEYRIIPPRRGELWIEVNAMPSRDPDGATVWYGFLTDTTQRKRAEMAARQWERAFDQTALAIALHDPQHETFQAVNKSFALQRGHSPQELSGRPVFSMYKPSEWDSLAVRLEEVDRGSGHILFESIHVRKDGSSFPVLVDLTAVRDESGSVASRVAIVRDLTESKAAEAKLRRSEALFRAILRNMPDLAVFVVDRELRYVSVEGSLAARIGYPRANLEGRTIYESLDSRAVAVVDPLFRRGLAGESDRFEFTLSDRVCDCKLVPLRSGPGDVVAAMILVHDVTERKETENQIRALNSSLEDRVRSRTAQLEAANKELETFAYSVSHDLRAPLRGIDGWSLALLQDYGSGLPDDAQIQLARVRSETHRMGELIEDLLKFSRLTRAGMTMQPVDLSAISQNIARRLQKSAPDREIAWNISAGLTAAGDPRLVEIALTNLLDNAFKFTSKRRHAQIDVGLMPGEFPRVFYVADNGVGFNMSYANQLFGVFQRLHRAADFPGTGIGLATVERIVRRHGGRVWAEAEEDRGAKFFFSFEEANSLHE